MTFDLQRFADTAVDPTTPAVIAEPSPGLGTRYLNIRINNENYQVPFNGAGASSGPHINAIIDGARYRNALPMLEGTPTCGKTLCLWYNNKIYYLKTLDLRKGSGAGSGNLTFYLADENASLMKKVAGVEDLSEVYEIMGHTARAGIENYKFAEDSNWYYVAHSGESGKAPIIVRDIIGISSAVFLFITDLEENVRPQFLNAQSVTNNGNGTTTVTVIIPSTTIGLNNYSKKEGYIRRIVHV